ncbi:MAG: VanZ family protein [Firmicutes bacterium]|nr:VanZ family protein [Bacillota bacterium]
MSNIKHLSKIVAWSSVVLWMAVIFVASSQPAQVSSELSTGFTEILLHAVASVFNVDITTGANDYLAIFHHGIRKAGHFTAYFILALLVVVALRKSGISGRNLYLVAFAICLVYAISDETHQLFVAGRAGQISDVFIDSSGAVAALLLSYGVLRPRRVRKI